MICNLCKKEIITKKERYVHVEDWNKEIIIKDIWCHLSCFNKAMNRDLTETEKKAKEMLDKASRVLDSDYFKEMFPMKEEVVVIP
jgi:hypothetical protein